MATKGEVIQRLREERDWTLEELAARVGMSYTAVRNREAGVTKIKADEEELWAKVFDLDVAAFRRMWQQTMSPSLHVAEDRGIPIINKAPAGSAWDYESHGATSRHGKAYTPRLPGEESDSFFAVEVVGDSMQPELKPKDIVVLYPVEQGIPPQAIESRIVLASFSEEAGGGVCLAKLEFAGNSDPERGLEVTLRKINPKHKSKQVYLTDLVNLAVARRVARDV